MKKILNILCGTMNLKSPLADLFLALPRVFGGVLLMLEFGLAKFPVSSGFIGDIRRLGFPAPEIFAWLAVLAEVAGGLCLAAGLATRLSASLVAITMGVAAFMAKAGDPLVERLPALFFLVIAWHALVVGSGRFGLDALVRKFLLRPRAAREE